MTSGGLTVETFGGLAVDGDRILEPGTYDYWFKVVFERELHPVYGTPRNREFSGRIELGEPKMACFVAFHVMNPKLAGMNPDAIRVSPLTFERVEAEV